MLELLPDIDDPTSGRVVKEVTHNQEVESRRQILQGHFHIYLLEKLQFVFEKTNINEKEAGEGQLYLKKTLVRFGQ